MYTVRFRGKDYPLTKGRYSNGRVALVLGRTHRDGWLATVNIPDFPLKPSEVFIKNYSENEGILEALIEAGIVSHPIDYVQSNYVIIPYCQLMIDLNKVPLVEKY